MGLRAHTNQIDAIRFLASFTDQFREKVSQMALKYGQAVVLTRSDFSFPHDATLSEATPNIEMLLFSDLDLEKLKVLHNEGTVRNLLDRRKDLYSINFSHKYS